LKLTETQILKLTCPAGKKDVLVKDDGQPGLFLRVGANGGRSYLAQYSFAGTKRRIPLGNLTLANARSAAAAILGEVAHGRDPSSDRKAKALETKRKATKDAFTLDVLLEQWAALHLAGSRASYSVEAVRAAREAFAAHLKAPAADLTRADVIAVLDKLTAAGSPHMASRAVSYGRAAFTWAMRRGTLAATPFQNLPLAPVVKRDRVLTDDELRAIWQSTAGPGAFNNVVRMLMLTAQRRDEVAGMSWGELSEDLAVWQIPAARAKNGVEHVVPLSPQAQEIIKAAPRYAGNLFVFPGEGGAFKGWHKAKARLDEASGVSGWVIHDLRRTVATNLQKLGVRLEVTEAVLNHVGGSRGGIIGVYQRHTWADEKAAALAAWGARVEAIVEGREAVGNVVDMRASA
jgi:integrase